MTIYSWLIPVLWLAFLAVWAVSGLRAKRSIRSGMGWWREIALRLVIIALILIGLRLFGFSHAVQMMRLHAINRSPVAGLIGAALCAGGVGLAILARLYLGRNWGMPMSRKEEPELVTAGPYAVIRHPIYTGILIAILGSAIGLSILWMFPLVLAAPYFIYSARREERLMIEQFPDQYPAYMRRTRMLLPYLL